jgi:methionine-rich copper-binding protein CopC
MRIARLVTAAVAATALVVFAGGAPAFAHNPMVKSAPAKNATVKESPQEVELTFLEAIGKTFSIEVTDAQQQKVPTGKATVAGKKGTAAFTGELANGTYTVSFRLVAEDGDPVQGSYKFTVAAPAASSAAPSPAASADPVVASAAPAATPVQVADADTSDDGPNGGLIAAIIAGVVVIGAVVVFLLRRRA